MSQIMQKKTYCFNVTQSANRFEYRLEPLKARLRERVAQHVRNWSWQIRNFFAPFDGLIIPKRELVNESLPYGGN